MLIVLLILPIVALLLWYVVGLKARLVHLHGFWYLDKRYSAVVQFFNWKEYQSVRKLKNRGSYTLTKYIYTGMKTALASGKLESNKEYYTENHLVKHLAKQPNVKVISATPKKPRYLTEMMFFTGVIGYLKARFASDRDRLLVLPYDIVFVKKQVRRQVLEKH